MFIVFLYIFVVFVDNLLTLRSFSMLCAQMVLASARVLGVLGTSRAMLEDVDVHEMVTAMACTPKDITAHSVAYAAATALPVT